jgi:hypothetical protein
MTSRTRWLLLSACALIAAVGAWYGVRAGGRQETEIAELVQRTNRQRNEINQLRAERDRLPRRISESPTDTPPAFATGDAIFNQRMDATLERIEQLRRWLKENPAEQLPEFQFLQDTDWIDAVADDEAELDL